MKLLGGWPLVKSHKWDEKTFRYQKFVQDAELLGFPENYLFGFGLIVDLKNDTNRILIVSNIHLEAYQKFK